MNGWFCEPPPGWKTVADAAIQEDVGASGDVTSSIFDPDHASEFMIESQSDGILCGGEIARYVLEHTADPAVPDGSPVSSGTHILEGWLPTRRLLTRERTALNFLMHLSGVATKTHHFVNAVQGTRAKIVDTRKTIPGIRALQKYAVVCGGGKNHRFGLSDGILIKDNHILAAGSITHAVESLRKSAHHLLRIEVECTDLNQVEEAVKAGAEIILLDNMKPAIMRNAVKKFSDRCYFEASGGIELANVREVADTGVDFISVGGLTHSAPALPFHLEFLTQSDDLV